MKGNKLKKLKKSIVRLEVHQIILATLIIILSLTIGVILPLIITDCYELIQNIRKNELSELTGKLSEIAFLSLPGIVIAFLPKCYINKIRKDIDKAAKIRKDTANLLNIRTMPATRKLALPITYLHHIEQSNWKIKINLSFCAGIFFSLNWKFPQVNLLILPLVLLVLLSLLIIKEQLMEYRIKKGLFGTNRTEAKAIIEFIIKNSEDIDFTDSNGNLRRALLPEAKAATNEQSLPAFGEEAPA
ncbi:MAG: hypothetical protein D3919_12465 [Candidatus Electrothrix sp. AW5]|nr:hypothetical protein [Candidatus Electrothrix gigas]